MTVPLEADISGSAVSSTALPVVTRMLLCADGSTTVLLEALVRAELTAISDQQEQVPLAKLPARFQNLLDISPDDDVVERRTRLVTPDMEVVSTNLVLVPCWGADEVLPPARVPLGRHLARNDLVLRRAPLGRSVEVWSVDGASRPCTGKDYLIHCRSGVPIYVKETFNPDTVPVGPADWPC